MNKYVLLVTATNPPPTPASPDLPHSDVFWTLLGTLTAMAIGATAGILLNSNKTNAQQETELAHFKANHEKLQALADENNKNYQDLLVALSRLAAQYEFLSTQILSIQSRMTAMENRCYSCSNYKPPRHPTNS